jgi:hypothetical protein
MKSSEVCRVGTRNCLSQFLSVCTAMLICFVALGMTGCMTISTWRHKEPPLTKADPPLSNKSSAEEILARINENAYSEFAPDGLKSYRCDDVKVRMKGVPAPMRASIVVEAPRNLRLRVAHPLTGGEAVDLGSNDQEFWFWAKDSQPANVLVCSHDHIAAATQVTTLPLPFRPDWLMEVLGVTPISGSGYEVRRTNNRSPIVELVSVQRTPDQKPVRRIVKVNMTYGVVLEHRIESTDGQMIAKATLNRHFRDPGTRLVLPRQISIDWPAAGQELALSLEFTSVDFNAPAQSVAMWTVPKVPGFPEVDIGAIAVKQLGKDYQDPAHPDAGNAAIAGRATIDNESEAEPSDAGENAIAEAGAWSEETPPLETIDRPTQTVSVAEDQLPKPGPLASPAIEAHTTEPGGDARPFPE